MFEALSEKLSGVFDKLRRRGSLNEADVTEALREVRLALLDADVALEVVRDFIAKVRERAIGAEVLKSVSPGQQVVKHVDVVSGQCQSFDRVTTDVTGAPGDEDALHGRRGHGRPIDW